MISATINSMKEDRSSQKRIRKNQQMMENEEDSEEFYPSDESSESLHSRKDDKKNFNNVGKNLCAFINRKTDKRSLDLD